MNQKLAIIIVLLFIGILGISGFVKNNSNDSAAVIDIESQSGFNGSVDPQEFLKLIDSEEYIVLDLRTLPEYEESHITDEPMLIDFYQSDFKSQLDNLDKDGKYLIYCNSGNRSSSAVDIMEDFGFTDFYELKGGITAWKNESHPVIICSSTDVNCS
jgi:phage shock protein E